MDDLGLQFLDTQRGGHLLQIGNDQVINQEHDIVRHVDADSNLSP